MQRLKTRPQFQAAMAGGIVSRTPHFALHRLRFDAASAADAGAAPGAGDTHQGPSDTSDAGTAHARRLPPPLFARPDVWLGAMVPKRWARRAVTRNAIKRQIYTVCGGVGASFPPAAYVVRLRSGFDRTHFVSATSEPLKRAVRAEVEQLIARVLRPGAAASAASGTVA